MTDQGTGLRAMLHFLDHDARRERSQLLARLCAEAWRAA